MGLFKRDIIGTYIETSDKELLKVYMQEIKNLGLTGIRSKKTLIDKPEFLPTCKYFIVHKSGVFAQSMSKPKGTGCRPIKRSAIIKG